MQNLTQHNKKAVEALLEKTLKKMAGKLDISLDEWDIDRNLFEAFLNSPNLKSIKKLSKLYDNIYTIAEAFNVRKKINPKYIWFTDLLKKNKIK